MREGIPSGTGPDRTLAHSVPPCHTSNHPAMVCHMTPTEKPEAYSINAVAQLAGISRETVYREIRAGRLTAVRVGQPHAPYSLLIKPADYDRWWEEYNKRPYRVVTDPSNKRGK